MENLVFWLIAAVIAIFIFVGLMLVKRFLSPDEVTREPERQLEKDSIDGILGSLTPALAGIIPETVEEAAEFRQLLRRAGYYRPSARGSVYALRFLLLFIPLVTTFVLALVVPTDYGVPVLMAGAILSVLLSIIPRFYIYLRQQSRVLEIRHGLADMMDMLSMCLSGGLSVGASLEHVARNLTSYPALSQELHIIQRQAEMGSLKHALSDFAKRIDVPDVRQLSSLLSRGDRLGSQLSDSLHEHADHFRETRKQVAIMQANRAPVKLTFPLVFCFAPAALILLMAPAMLDISDFVRNSEEILGQSQIVQQIEQLEQPTAFEVGQSRPDTGDQRLLP